ncbi:N2,N2-dimethylguanosine tRNA methyltransferase [Pisolithus microcarpus]|nr:N2,N2-dimethylguanosine tRNA methyltransferase [Pisolithus microcarpus]
MSTAAATVPIAGSTSANTQSGIVIPEGIPNPVQEFNRDLSVACIRVWSEMINREKEVKWKQAQERRARRTTTDATEGKEVKKVKVDDVCGSSLSAAQAEGHDTQVSGTLQTSEGFTKNKEYRPYKFVLLEALSATGLRSIRYAKEIPLVKFSATAAMRRNVDLNGLGPSKVRVNEGDACALMYNHRTEKTRADAVDLDPYGTAAPFLDAACLLCVTCTDLAVLATTNYFEKVVGWISRFICPAHASISRRAVSFSNYGGIPVKAEYCHELWGFHLSAPIGELTCVKALRLVLNTISTSAGRYGRYIEPLLALSVDFYVRLFVRVHSGPVEVKKAASNTSMYYICSGCQSFFAQKLGRTIEKINESTGSKNYHSVSGPMWSGPLHNTEFVSKVLDHVEGNLDKYGTSARMRGMLTVAKEELHTPFYFTPAKVAGFFHCTTPSLEEGSDLKTTASRTDIYDCHPVKMDKISNTIPKSVTQSSKVKLVRYQQNPLPNWGPGSKASGIKRKRTGEDNE